MRRSATPSSRNPLARDPLAQRSRAGFDPLCGSFRTLLHLRTLLLRDIGADDGEAESVAAFVSSSARVESLDLSQNQVRFPTTHEHSSQCVGHGMAHPSAQAGLPCDN